MFILVTDNEMNEEIFKGDADEFLEENDYDSELELCLNELDCMPINSTTTFCGFMNDSFTIEKIEDEETMKFFNEL